MQRNTLRTTATVLSLLLLLTLPACDPVGAEELEVYFADFELAPTFEPTQWDEAHVPLRQARHFGRDLHHLASGLMPDLAVDAPVRLEDGHRLVIDGPGSRLELHALSGAWRFHDRAAEASLEKAAMTPEEAAAAVRAALSKVVDLEDRELSGVAANTLTEELDDGGIGEERVLSYTVFFRSSHRGVQLVGGGVRSAGTVTGSAGKPRILSLSHAPGDFDPAAGKILDRRAGQLIDEATARQRLLRGEVLIADTPPDSVISATVTRDGLAYFVDGRFLHPEAIPVYVYQVVFKPLAGEPFAHNYFVSALDEKGWTALGYDKEQLAVDSRHRPGIAGYDAVPSPYVWQDDDKFAFVSPAERDAVLAFGTAHCMPQWLALPANWEYFPACFNLCGDRASVCAALGTDPDREYAITVRWNGLGASHFPGATAATMGAYRTAWVDRLRTGFEEACWRPDASFGNNGVVSSVQYPFRPDRPDVVAAADSTFYFHMGHAWGSELVECPDVTKRFSNIVPSGTALNPNNFTSCGIRSDWSGTRLRYFFNMASFANAGRRQWTRVVGGGSGNPKVVIGHISHGNRFHFSPYAPDPSTPPSAGSYPNMLANFFRNLALTYGSNPLVGCQRDGMSFRAAMREAVIGTGTSRTDYHWGAQAHNNQPMAMRLVFSTRDQALDEHLPGWGPQYPNDGNYSGWEYIAWGSEYSP